MNILVCIGNVPDTTTKVKFADNKLDTTGIQWIINPWDELALTRALELKESGAGVDKISVVSVGAVGVEATMRKALAIGADDAFRVDVEPTDAYFTAAQIAELVKTGSYDVVLAGIENSDYNGVSIGGMLAEILDYASVSAVSALNIEGGKLVIDREVDGGKEKISTETPVVLTVQKGIALDPRIPAMRGIMMARRKPLTVVPAVSVDNLTEIVSYELPAVKGACKLFDAEDAVGLVNALKNEAKVI
ncbi:MAG: electron transfer flavoprotein beta subunit/FixA family protein [Bacteroidetes bacterium]|nr:MAG: electron transfer flavoprotein beta subunit/FixA family protein [Bacteroidota bacterium]